MLIFSVKLFYFGLDYQMMMNNIHRFHFCLLRITDSGSRCAGFQHLNSTTVSIGTKARKQHKTITLQEASIIGLPHVSAIFYLFFQSIRFLILPRLEVLFLNSPELLVLIYNLQFQSACLYPLMQIQLRFYLWFCTIIFQ